VALLLGKSGRGSLVQYHRRTPRARNRLQIAFRFLEGYRAVNRFKANGESAAVLTPGWVVQAVW
jgi:hypothetical protein